ncbi:MAG: aminotransferase class V-fold PLP-dependent enzyme [Parvibaculaceae bacterium]
MSPVSPIDVARVRAETPGVDHVLHLNNAGAALPPRAVTEAVTAHLELEERIGGYEAYGERVDAIENTYDALARLLNARADEIALLDCATRAWDMAFYSLPLRAGDRILTSRSEYSSNFIAFLHLSRRVGVTVEAVPDDESGQLSLAALERAIGPDVKLIAVTHVPTSGGLVNPAAGIGRLARAAGVPFLLDACQSCGQMPLDVAEIQCDMLSGTGRKYLRGPRGTGFLYVRKALLDRLDPPFLDDHAATWITPERYVMRDDARRFETWESYVAGRIGLGVAVDYALAQGIEASFARIRHLAGRLRARLAGMGRISLHDQGREKCGIVTFSIAGMEADAVREALRVRAINVTVSTRESTLIDMTARGLDRMVRASVHYYNDEDEIDRFVAALEQIMPRASRTGWQYEIPVR